MNEFKRRPQCSREDETLRIDSVTDQGSFQSAQSILRPGLIVIQGMDRGKSVVIEERPVTIGRSDECDFVISDDGISRSHAKVYVSTEGQCVIEDLGSKNGIRLTEERIHRHVMGEGDKLVLGTHTVLRFMKMDRYDEIYHKEMYESAIKDGLTGVFNRRYLDELLRNEMSFSFRHRTPLSILLLDIDHFKFVNDRHGHLVGDVVLQRIARILREALRGEDVMARYGGEEFVLVARSIDLEGAIAFAERVRVLVQNTRFLAPEGMRVPVTISIGVVTFHGEPEVTGAELLGVADSYLYQAKAAGRNRVVAGVVR